MNYERRTYNNRDYYYWDNTYYYEYNNDGPPVYVAANVVNGVPTVPPKPYLYTLPQYSIRTFSGVSFYDSYGFYYYVYYIDGRSVYVLSKIVDGLPTVPPQPY